MKRRATALALLAGAFLARHAEAAAPGFAVDRFEPSERGSDWFEGDSLDIRGNFRPAAGVVGDFTSKPLVFYTPNGTEESALVSHQDILHLGANVTFLDRLRVGVNLPVALFEDGQTSTFHGTTYQAPAGAAVGDLRLGADLRLFGNTNGVLTMAAGAQLFLPTGDQAEYMSDGTARVEPRVLAAGRVGPFVYAAKLAIDYRPSDGTVAGTSRGSEFLFSAAAGIKLLDDRLVVGPEIFGSTVMAHGTPHDTPFEGILGAHYTFLRDYRVGAGVGPGLSHGDGAPAVRGLVSLEWAPAYERPHGADRDEDGVADADDACPDVAGIRTDDPKTNGCPADRDHDGIIDFDDACPDVAGVRTGDPKTNGCPSEHEHDRDHDGIADAEDACPDVAGVRTSDPKTNGCPVAPDRDHDGIAEAEDACPDVAGVRTSDPKTNGCPVTPDRDHDGVPDAVDACPDDPGPSDPDPKRNGCPRAVVKNGQIQILDQIKFRVNSAELDPASDPVLEAVRSVLAAHPEIGKLRIEGHTDNSGSPTYNLTLSGRRAASVAAWLGGHGIARSKLASVGFGSAHPLVSNEDEQGRRLNRRVEFHIVDAKE